MTAPTSTTHGPRACRGAAFSLIEVIVAIVILGTLASISVVGYNAVQERARESVATDTIVGVMREANALAQQDARDVFTAEDFIASTGDLTAAYSEGVMAIDLNNGWTLGVPPDNDPAYSDSTTTVHVGTHPLQGWEIAGVALRTENGHCAMTRATPGQPPESWVIKQDIGVNCNGYEAANGSTDLPAADTVSTPAPSDIVAVPGTTTAAVSFTAPVGDGAGAVVAYETRLTPTAGGAPVVQPTTTTTANFSSLTNGASYDVAARARYASGTWSAWAGGGEVVPYTYPDAPLAPLAAPGDAQAGVTWEEPEFDGGRPVTQYQLEVRQGATVAATYTVTGLARVTSGLTNGLPYTFRVRAFNLAGWSSWSAASTAVTPFTSPSAPTGLVATPGNMQVALDWDTPFASAAQPVEGYYVYRNGVIACIATPRTSSNCTMSGLTNGTEYAFQVAAYYTTLQSAVSAPVLSTPRTVPNAPTAVSAAVAVQTATVSFSPITASPQNGGSPVIDYRATCSSNTGGTTRTTTAASGPISVANLTAANTYTCTVAARNVVGWSAESAPSGTLTPLGPPPPAGTPSPTPDDSSVLLTWTPLPNTPANPVAGYRIYRDGVIGCIVVGATSDTCVVSGLTNGTQYSFQLQAYSATDSGAISPAATATPRTIPTAPLIGTAARSYESLSVSFTGPSDTAPANGGSGLLDWRASCTSSDGGANQSQIGAGSPIVVPNLTAGSTYTCTVAARNAAGFGPESAPSAQVSPFTAPGTPLLDTATPANTAVTLTWSPPATDDITGYRIYVDGSVRSIVADPDQLSSTVSALVNGTPYSFQVSAYFAEFESPLSNVLYATPRTVPAPPSVIATNAVGTRAEVTFTAPADNGGSPVDNYEVECVSTTSGTDRNAFSPTVAPVTVINLTPDETYECSARARNAIGWGAWSSPGTSFDAVAEPLAVTGLTVTRGDEELLVTWDALLSTVENPVTGYRIWRTGSPVVTVAGDTTDSETLVGLTNGTTYPIQIQAYHDPDGAGPTAPAYGPLSDPTNGVPAGLPSTPTGVTAAAAAGTATVSFAMPVPANGSAITAYESECVSSNGGTTRTASDTDGSPVAVSGLTAAADYTCRVRAENAVGWGSWSVASNVVSYS